MRRTTWFTVSPLLFLSVLAGCRDGAVAPTGALVQAPSAAAPAPMSLAPQGRPSLSLSGGFPDSAAVDFTVSPSGGSFFAGNHAVVFPAGSICDPATSSYGPGTWDDPCTPLQSSVRIHAEVRRANGQTSVDFSPALRFVPSSNPAKWVWMLMYSPDAIGSTDLTGFNIMWAPTPGAALVDESIADSTLRTYVDTWQGISLRRIKHFSEYDQGGYGVGAGRSCDPATQSCP